MYIINLLGSASPPCVLNLSCSGTNPSSTFWRIYDQLFIEVPKCISIFNFSAEMWNVFHVSMLCMCNRLLFEVWWKWRKSLERDRGDCYLTLLPLEIPPVHLSALPRWTPSPGSFHCGTAEEHSHQARQEEDTNIDLSSIHSRSITLYTCKKH